MGKKLALLCATAVFAVAGTAWAADKPAEPFKVPRNEFNHPELGGFWNNSNISTLERPAQYGERNLFTPEEVAKLEGARP